jgi:hypothetical protein
MVLDEKKNPVFLNSREFNSAAAQILPYVGASILRNAETLEFPELDAFLTAHPEVPALTKSPWKQEAVAMMKDVGTMTYDQQRDSITSILVRLKRFAILSLFYLRMLRSKFSWQCVKPTCSVLKIIFYRVL